MKDSFFFKFRDQFFRKSFVGVYHLVFHIHHNL